MTDDVLKLGIVGFGGFARAHHKAARELEKEGLCRLICATSRDPSRYADAIEGLEMEKRGVRVYRGYDEMLKARAGELDVMGVPTPIHLHAPMHADCVENGIACYLEKPPTLVYDELERMLKVEEKAVKSTFVGFNFIYEPPRQAMKKRVLQGEFGALKRVSYLGLWARPASYYERAGWAGKLFLEDYPVLDSCLGNAMAHLVFNILFWCGTGELLSWGEVEHVRAELYRANPIQSTDTMFVSGVTKNGIELRFAASHACEEGWLCDEIIECEKARIVYRLSSGYTIEWTDGKRETGELARGNATVENFRRYLAYVRGEEKRPLIRLADTESYVRFYDLIYVAARNITPVPEQSIKHIVHEDSGEEYHTVRGLSDAARVMVNEGRMPGEQGLRWAKSGGEAGAGDLGGLYDVLNRMR
ncbi:MAG: Gfo/Idh/MocA family oxidoreductase [Kiritimatiellia bacterium]